jgi:adenylate cyclase
MTKSLGCEVIFSDEVRTTAGLADDALPRQDIEIRGRAGPINVCVVAKADTLSAFVDDQKPVAA